jgi:K+/H+ antiporter YhaU regulatory subunit KhtT
MGALREEHYEMLRILPIPGQPLRHLWNLLPQVGLERFVVAPGAPLEGVELRELDLRARSGVAVLAVVHGTQVIHNPDASFRFGAGDQVVLIGSREQLASATHLLDDSGLKTRRADAGRSS